MDFRGKYLKYKIKYIELKNQIGGLFSASYQMFVKRYPELKREAKNRKDKLFIMIEDEYIDEFNRLIDDQILFKQNIKKMTAEEKKEKNVEFSNREDSLKKNIFFKDLTELKEKMTPFPELLEWTIRSYIEGTIKRVEDIASRLKPAIEDIRLLQKVKETKIKIEELKGLIGVEEYLSRPEIVEELEKIKKKKIETEEEKEKGRKGGEIIYDGKDIKIIKLITKEGSCYYGQGTKWCTAAKTSENMFDAYNEEGALYIIQPKKPKRENEKYQLHFGTEQYMDEKDEEINMLELYEKYPEVGEMGKIDNRYYNEIFRSAIDGDDKEMTKFAMERMREIKNWDVVKAAYKGDREIFEYLIDKGGKLESEEEQEEGEIPLHLAILGNSIKTVKKIIEEGANIEKSDNEGDRAIHIAAGRYGGYRENTEIIKYLISNGADLGAKNNEGETPLHKAISAGNVENVKYIGEIEKNNAKNRDIMITALRVAMSEWQILEDNPKYEERIEIIKYITNKLGRTEKSIYTQSMHEAIGNKEMPEDVGIKIIDHLLDNGAEIGTSLIYAVSKEKIKIIKYLVERGADPLMQMPDGATAIDIGLKSKNEKVKECIREIAYEIIRSKKEKKENGMQGGKILYDGKDINIIEIETKEDAKYYGKGTIWYMTSQLLMLSEKEIDTQYIIEIKNPIRDNEKYKINITGKQIVNEKGEPVNIIELLKKYPEIMEFENKSHDGFILYFHIFRDALRLGEREVIYGIISKANINLVDYNRNTLLMIAVAEGNLEVVKYLVERGANLRIKNDLGMTALHIAAGGKIDIVKYLVEIGAATNIKDEFYRTPLDEAKEKGNDAVVKYLNDIQKKV